LRSAVEPEAGACLFLHDDIGERAVVAVKVEAALADSRERRK